MAAEIPVQATLLEGITHSHAVSRYIEKWRKDFFPAFGASEVQAEDFGHRTYDFRQEFYNLLGLMNRSSFKGENLSVLMDAMLQVRRREMHTPRFRTANPQKAQDLVIAVSEMIGEIAPDVSYDTVPIDAFRQRAIEMTLLFEQMQELVAHGNRWPRNFDMREFQLRMQMVEEQVMQSLLRGEWTLPTEVGMPTVKSSDSDATMPRIGENHSGIAAVMKQMVSYMQDNRSMLEKLIFDEEALEVFAVSRNVVRQAHLHIPGRSHLD